MADKSNKNKNEKSGKENLKKGAGRDASSKNSGNESAKGGGFLFSILSLFSALVIIAVVLAGFLFVLIRFNLMGVADTYKTSIEKVPLLKLALPVEKSNDPNELTFDDLFKENASLRKENTDLKSREEYAMGELERLRAFEDEYQARMMVNDEKTRNLEAQIAELEADKKRLSDAKYEVERMVAEGDKEGFRDYFETVEPAVAREMYTQIIQEQKITDEAKEFIKLYESLEPSSTAGIFEEMGLSRLDLIAECLKGMKREISAEILGAMSTEFAAAVTLRLASAF